MGALTLPAASAAAALKWADLGRTQNATIPDFTARV